MHDLQQIFKADANPHVLQGVFDVEEGLKLPQEVSHFFVVLVYQSLLYCFSHHFCEFLVFKAQVSKGLAEGTRGDFLTCLLNYLLEELASRGQQVTLVLA